MGYGQKSIANEIGLLCDVNINGDEHCGGKGS